MTLGLLRSGMELLGDDTVFLSRKPSGLLALAFPDEIDVTEQTAGWFPDLAATQSELKCSLTSKQQISVEQIGAQVVLETQPSVVVFPSIVDAEASLLEPMESDSALLALVPNILLTDSRLSQHHLDILGQLVKSTDCYRLHVGRRLSVRCRLVL